MQEMGHLEKISECIYLLEGEVTPIPNPLPQVGETTDAWLRLDHTAENDAILLYTRVLAEALKQGNTATCRMFEDIVIQEEEHYWEFDDFF